MKILKNKVNILLLFSTILFIVSILFHISNTNNIAKAQPFVGSTGGRIATVIETPPPPACVGVPCACRTTFTTTITPYGTIGAIICPPNPTNVSTAGLPITLASPGFQILGFWTVSGPTAESTNWGTFP